MDKLLKDGLFVDTVIEIITENVSSWLGISNLCKTESGYCIVFNVN
ncbi:hypothetical protein ACRYCR_04705 [Bartonella sp. C271]